MAIPDGRSVCAARGCWSPAPKAGATVEGGRVEIEVPGIDLIEVVHIDWA